MADVAGSSRSGQTSVSFTKSRRVLLQFLVICLPLWLSIKIYDGPYGDIVRYLSGVLFIIILALIVQLVQPRMRETPLLILLFVIFTVVELVCWQYPHLFENISFSLAGQPIIGDAFSLNKIPYYGVGAFIGYFVLKACRLK